MRSKIFYLDWKVANYDTSVVVNIRSDGSLHSVTIGAGYRFLMLYSVTIGAGYRFPMLMFPTSYSICYR